MKEKELTVSGFIQLMETGESKEIEFYSFQLAEMFHVYERTIITHIRAIIQAGVIVPSSTCKLRQVRNVLIPDTHDLEMVIALAFRIHSSEAAKLRKWIMAKLILNVDKETILLRLNNPLSLN